MKPQHHCSVTVYVRGIEVACHGVTLYPYVPATQIDPPEEAFVEYEQATIFGNNAEELFTGELGKELEAALIKHLEN